MGRTPDVSGTHRLETDDPYLVEIRDEEEPAPGRGGRGGGGGRRTLLVGALAVVAFAALAVWGWRAASARDDARHQAADLSAKNQSLEDALELHRTSKLQLDNELSSCKTERDTTSKAASKLEVRLSVCQDARSNLEEQTDQVQARLAELDSLTSRFRAMVNTGDLSVKIRRGQMVVDLPSAVLFASGEAALSAHGKETLGKVAAVLKTMPGRKFTIAGHTDSRPIRRTEFASNWSLSAARAVTVTEQLIASGVKPKNLVAAGYSQYAPIASNRSVHGRQLNRRIEIILEPDLAKVPKSALHARKSKPKPKHTKKHR